jgi:chromosome segregation ATPase
MNIAPATVETMSSAFQVRHAAFVEARAAYLDSQNAFEEVTKETERLEQAAQALDAQAEETDASWKELAKARRADQRKINQTVERAVELKMEAEKLRRIAAVRAELREEMLLRVIETRGEATAARTALQGLYREERTAALFDALKSAEGLPALLRELRELAGDGFDGMISQIAAQAGAPDFSLLKQIGLPAQIPAEAEYRPKTPGEKHRERMAAAAH